MTEQQTPTPIDPAEIRPGDVVERRQRLTIEARYVEEDEIRLHTKQDRLDHPFGVVWSDEDDGWTWHLVHRPDPDAEAVEAIAKAIHEDGFFTAWDEIDEIAREQFRSRARAALAAIREHDAKRADQ